MDGTATYNGGMQLGVRPFAQTSSRMGAFFSGASTVNTNIGSSANSAQQTAPKTYQPSSVISALPTTPNGQSATTYAANRALNYYRQ